LVASRSTVASSRSRCGLGSSGRNLGIPKSPLSPNHASSGFVDSRTAAAHFMARCSACRPSMPKTYLGRRQPLFSPVICTAHPQSEPGTAWGTPMVSTTGFPLADWNRRRAAIRRIVRGAAKDLLIRPERNRIRLRRAKPLFGAASRRSGSPAMWGREPFRHRLHFELRQLARVATDDRHDAGTDVCRPSFVLRGAIVWTFPGR